MGLPRSPLCAARGGMTREEVKEAVRERDGYRCTKCGMSEDDHVAETGRRMDVHRTSPGSVYTVAGCVLLCRVCHGPEPKRPTGTVNLDGRDDFMVRLPESYRERLTRLVGRTKRKMTTEVQLALDKHFRDEKID